MNKNFIQRQWLLGLVFLFSGITARGQFSGAFAPSNWVLTQIPANVGGSVNVSNAPTSISITSGNNGLPGSTIYSITIISSGTVNLNWSYFTTDSDGSNWDLPRYAINSGNHIQLTGFIPGGPISQTGTQSIAVNSGDILRLIMYTVDGGYGPATTTFSFSASPACTAPTLSTIINNQSCQGTNDGSINLTATGGSPAPTFAWTGPNNFIASTEDISNLQPGTYTIVATSGACSTSANYTVNAGASLTSNTTTIAACGSYTWSQNNTTYTTSGTYSVTNGCHTEILELTINSNPVISAGTSMLVCPNTPVVLTGSGGLTYTWNNGIVNGAPFTPTANGTYTVIGTDVNGCSASASVNVNIKQFVLTSLNSVICKGSSVTLIAPAGTNYKWKKNGATMKGKTASTLVVNKAGTYTVFFTDAQCGNSISQPITLNIQNSPATPSITPANVQICAGDTLTMSAPSGYSSYIWKLSNVVIPGATTNTYSTNANGSYKVAVVDTFGCISGYSGTKTVKVNPLPTPNFNINTVVSTGARKLSSTNNGSFQWNLNGSPIPGATAKIYIATTSGSYSLTFTNSKGCVATSPDTTLTINLNRSMKEENVAVISSVDDMQSNVVIYPNPSSGLFFIESSQVVNAVVRDIQGKLIMNIKNAQEINLSEQPSGMYLLQLISEEGKLLQSVKLMKQ